MYCAASLGRQLQGRVMLHKDKKQQRKWEVSFEDWFLLRHGNGSAGINVSSKCIADTANLEESQDTQSTDSASTS
eukprot:scaffold168505_cov21-Tisochrysis_lutea.AAC.3